MTEDEADRHSRSRGGAAIEVRDSRVSALVGVGLAVTPIAVVGIGAWIARSIADLNVTVARLVTQNEAVIKRLDQNDAHDERQDLRMDNQDDRINQNSRDIASMGGPNYRGTRGQH